MFEKKEYIYGIVEKVLGKEVTEAISSCGVTMPELVKKAVVEIYIHGYENDLKKINGLSNYDYSVLRDFLKELKDNSEIIYNEKE